MEEFYQYVQINQDALLDLKYRHCYSFSFLEAIEGNVRINLWFFVREVTVVFGVTGDYRLC